jgi:hypothetical protein
MLQRPYLRRSIDEIEQALRREWPNQAVLTAIRDELRLRDTNRAKELLFEIEQELHSFEIDEAAVVDTKLKSSTPSPAPEQIRAAKAKIAELRQRLLDLSNRNRLINFKHSSRGGRQIRIVGEWLPSLLKILEGDKPVELRPLPPLPTEPEDEEKQEFAQLAEGGLSVSSPAVPNELSKSAKDRRWRPRSKILATYLPLASVSFPGSGPLRTPTLLSFTSADWGQVSKQLLPHRHRSRGLADDSAFYFQNTA